MAKKLPKIHSSRKAFGAGTAGRAREARSRSYRPRRPSSSSRSSRYALRKRKIMLSGYIIAMVAWLVGMVCALAYFGMASGFVGWVFLVPFAFVGVILWVFGKWADTRRTRQSPTCKTVSGLARGLGYDRRMRQLVACCSACSRGCGGNNCDGRRRRYRSDSVAAVGGRAAAPTLCTRCNRHERRARAHRNVAASPERGPRDLAAERRPAVRARAGRPDPDLRERRSSSRQPFLDITTAVPMLLVVDAARGEQGLLGLAFHPNYAAQPPVLRLLHDGQRRTILERYTVSADDLNKADPNERPDHPVDPRLRRATTTAA